MTEYKYKDFYGLSPPTFFDQEGVDARSFGPTMGVANNAVLNHSWNLTPVQGPIPLDPLAGLHRMGLLDLVEHKEEERVTLVIHYESNVRMTKVFHKFGREMKRNQSSKSLLVVHQGIVKPISETQAKDLSGVLEFWTPDGTAKGRVFRIDLNKCLPKVEIWKPLPNKMKQVSQFLSNDLPSQTDPQQRLAVFAYLLSESVGDEKMALVISRVWYKNRLKMAEDLVKSANRQLATQTKRLKRARELNSIALTKEGTVRIYKKKAVAEALAKATAKPKKKPRSYYDEPDPKEKLKGNNEKTSEDSEMNDNDDDESAEPNASMEQDQPPLAPAKESPPEESATNSSTTDTATAADGPANSTSETTTAAALSSDASPPKDSTTALNTTATTTTTATAPANAAPNDTTAADMAADSHSDA